MVGLEAVLQDPVVALEEVILRECEAALGWVLLVEALPVQEVALAWDELGDLEEGILVGRAEDLG